MKEKKKEFLAEAVVRATKSRTAEKWVKHAKGFLFIKLVYETFSDTRYKYYRNKFEKKSAKLVQKVWKKYRSRLSTESMRKITKPNGRYTVYQVLDFMRNIRRTLISSNCHLHGNHSIKAKSVLYDFLKNMSNMNSMIAKHIRGYNLIKMIFVNLRNLQISKKA